MLTGLLLQFWKKMADFHLICPFNSCELDNFLSVSFADFVQFTDL